MKRKFVLIGLLVGSLATLAFLLCVKTFQPILIYQWDVSNQRKIASAYQNFIDKEKRLPESLEELVKNGYLPKFSSIYSSPDYSKGLVESSYKNSVYEVVSPLEVMKAFPRVYIRRVKESPDFRRSSDEANSFVHYR